MNVPEEKNNGCPDHTIFFQTIVKITTYADVNKNTDYETSLLAANFVIPWRSLTGSYLVVSRGAF